MCDLNDLEILNQLVSLFIKLAALMLGVLLLLVMAAIKVFKWLKLNVIGG